MAQIRICRVNIQIDRDPNSGIYYLHLLYKNEEELPIQLGDEIEPKMIHDILIGFLVKKKIKCGPKLVKNGISQILQRL